MHGHKDLDLGGRGAKWVIVISPFEDPAWRWVGDKLDCQGIRWSFRNGNCYRYPHESLWMLHALRCVADLRESDLVVSFHPHMTLRVAVAMWANRIKAPHMGLAFNHGNRRFFRGPALMAARRLLPRLDVVSVFSEREKQVYHQRYGIPLERFAFQHWAVNPPRVADCETTGVPDEPYVTCIGRNNRDLATLADAVRGLPVRLVVVTGHKQALSVTFPDNVEVRREAPARECMCLLRGSLFSIVPIVSDITGAGHMTLVSAMQLGKAQVVTNYDTVKDYFFGGVHGVWVEPGSVSSMRQGIQRLLNDDVFRRSCGERAKAFADRWLCEAATVRFAQRLMDAWLEGRTYDTEPQGWGDAKQEWV